LGLLLLGAVIAASSLLGPFGAGAIRYHTSDTTLNQVIGGDAAALLLVAPVCFVVGVLAWRGHPAAPVLALAPALFATYTFTQLVVGEEYLRLPGNNERYFPLLYAGFVLCGGVAVAAWRRIDPALLPVPSRRLERLAAVALLAVVLFLAGQHLPTLADALRDNPTRTEYLSSPTAFWLVTLMDLGIVMPAALVSGVGLLRGAGSARAPMYAIVGAYVLLGASVTGMGVTMYVNDDPDASLGATAGFAALTVVFAALAFALYRLLLRSRPASAGVVPATSAGDGVRGRRYDAGPRHPLRSPSGERGARVSERADRRRAFGSVAELYDRGPAGLPGRYTWLRTQTVEEYLDYLSTHSIYVLLDTAVREALFDDIRAGLDDRIVSDVDTMLYLARRATGSGQ